MRLLLIAVLLLALPAPAQEAEAPAPEAAIQVESDATGDAAIARRIRAIYGEIEALEGVSVEVDAGVVSLSGTVLDVGMADEAARLASRVEGVATVENQIGTETSVQARLEPAAERLFDRTLGLVRLLPLLGVALLVLLGFLFAGFRLARLSWPFDRIAPNAFIADLLRQAVRLAFLAVGVVIALDILGATAVIGTVLGAAGIFGLALGFAVRDTIENYIASIMLSLRQPFQPNDHVVIEGHEGLVARLTTRATIIMTLEGNHVRIPNAVVFKSTIINYSRNPERRFDFTLGVNADGNLARAVELGLETLEGLPFVLAEPKPLGGIESVGDSSVIVWFGGWIDQRKTDFFTARSESIRLVKRALEEADFELPEPIYRVRFDPSTAPAFGEVRAKTAEPSAPSAEDPTPARAERIDQVEDKVAEERESGTQSDLLDPAAPQE